MPRGLARNICAGAPVVARIEDDAAVVGKRRHVVAVAERRADGARIRIVELEARINEPVVVREIADVLHLRLGVVTRVDLVPFLDARRAAPPFVGKIAVDRDAPGGACHTNGLAGQVGLRGGVIGAREDAGGQ
jgi:hypothetical protein